MAPSLAWLFNSRDLITLSYAVLIGAVVALSVFTFDLSIQLIHGTPGIALETWCARRCSHTTSWLLNGTMPAGKQGLKQPAAKQQDRTHSKVCGTGLNFSPET